MNTIPSDQKLFHLKSGYGKWTHTGGWEPCPVCGDKAGAKMRHSSGAVMCITCKMVRDNLAGDAPLGHPSRSFHTWADYFGSQAQICAFDPDHRDVVRKLPSILYSDIQDELDAEAIFQTRQAADIRAWQQHPRTHAANWLRAMAEHVSRLAERISIPHPYPGKGEQGEPTDGHTTTQ